VFTRQNFISDYICITVLRFSAFIFSRCHFFLSLSSETLRNYFSQYGEVVDCVIMKDKTTNQSRGFGFVKFKDPNCVRTVLETKPHNLDGRNVSVVLHQKEPISRINPSNLLIVRATWTNLSSCIFTVQRRSELLKVKRRRCSLTPPPPRPDAPVSSQTGFLWDGRKKKQAVVNLPLCVFNLSIINYIKAGGAAANDSRQLRLRRASRCIVQFSIQFNFSFSLFV